MIGSSLTKICKGRRLSKRENYASEHENNCNKTSKNTLSPDIGTKTVLSLRHVRGIQKILHLDG